jgi:heme-degrading monooxygenase HmoA
MIARQWRGWVAATNRDAYAAYMHEVALFGYADVPGNLGVYMLDRADGDHVEFCMISLWDSIDSIRAFAGADYERAVFYPRDDEFLVDRELTVTHYNVFGSSVPTASVR